MKIYFEQFKFIADPLKTWDRSWIRLDLYLRSQNRVVYFEKKKKLQIFSFNQLKRSRKFNS